MAHGPPPIPRLPPARTLAVCGYKNSGKTTLLVEAIRELRTRGLSVGVVKTDVHGVRVDAEGSDSDRLFAAGAEVVVAGPGEFLARRREEVPAATGEELSVERIAERLTRRHDVVLVEGGKGSRLPKVWLERENESESPPPEAAPLLVLPWGGDRLPVLLSRVERWLRDEWSEAPRAGGILAGGGSRRMGRPKEELRIEDETLLERTGRLLAATHDPVVRLGGVGGPWTAVPDVPGVAGPLAGMTAAMRWFPAAAWTFLSCDLPNLEGEALAWLGSLRRPGVWAVIPLADGSPQPLCAVYEPMLGAALEELARSDRSSPSRLVGRDRVATPDVPPHLVASFRGANTPEEWERATGDRSPW